MTWREARDENNEHIVESRNAHENCAGLHTERPRSRWK
jgi:hypothetical protein